MFNFEIAIPSYGRADILPKKTLKMLMGLWRSK